MSNQKERKIDPETFRELVRPLTGLKITRAWKGYGTALFLELGQLRKVPRIPKRQLASGTTVGGGHYLKGRATVMIEFDWRIERPRSIEFGSASSEQKLINGIERLNGIRIANTSVVGRIPELEIEFRENRWLRSFAVIESQPEWTVFLLDGSCVFVKGGVIRHHSNAL